MVGFQEGPGRSNRPDDEELFRLFQSSAISATDKGANGGDALRIGKYSVVALLSCRGQATVFRAFDPDLGRDVVLKLYGNPNSPAVVTRMKQEAHALARIRSPYVAQCHGLESADNQLFLVLEWIPGRSLGEVLGEELPSERDALMIIRALAEGLLPAHLAGIIHGDVKPANVIVNPDGEIKLIDFGLARTLPYTAEAMPSGTAAYMAPEVAQGSEDIDARVDVFGIGAVLYHMLVGHPPYLADTAKDSIQLARVGRVPMSIADVRGLSKQSKQLVAKCLEFERSQRYSSVSEIIEAIDRHPLNIRSSSRASRWIIVGLFLIAAVFGSVSWLKRGSSSALPTELTNAQVELLSREHSGFDLGVSLAKLPSNRSLSTASLSTLIAGERLRIKIQPAKDCSIGLFGIEASQDGGHSLRCLLPQRDQSSAPYFISAGSERTVDVQLTESHGIDRWLVVASTDAIQPAGLLQLAIAPTQKSAAPNAPAVRGSVPLTNDSLATLAIKYVVQPQSHTADAAQDGQFRSSRSDVEDAIFDLVEEAQERAEDGDYVTALGHATSAVEVYESRTRINERSLMDEYGVDPLQRFVYSQQAALAMSVPDFVVAGQALQILTADADYRQPFWFAHLAQLSELQETEPRRLDAIVMGQRELLPARWYIGVKECFTGRTTPKSQRKTLVGRTQAAYEQQVRDLGEDSIWTHIARLELEEILSYKRKRAPEASFFAKRFEALRLRDDADPLLLCFASRASYASASFPKMAHWTHLAVGLAERVFGSEHPFRAQLELQLSECYSILDRHHASRAIAKSLITRYEDYPWVIGKAQGLLAKCDNYQGRPLEALAHAELEMEFFESLPESVRRTEGICFCLIKHAQAVSQIISLNLRPAQNEQLQQDFRRHCDRVLEQFPASPHNSRSAVHHELAKFASDAQLFEYACDLIVASIEAARTEDSPYLAAYISKASDIYRRAGKLDEAGQFLAQYRAEMGDAHSPRLKGIALERQALLHLARENYADAHRDLTRLAELTGGFETANAFSPFADAVRQSLQRWRPRRYLIRLHEQIANDPLSTYQHLWGLKGSAVRGLAFRRKHLVSPELTEEFDAIRARLFGGGHELMADPSSNKQQQGDLLSEAYEFVIATQRGSQLFTDAKLEELTTLLARDVAIVDWYVDDDDGVFAAFVLQRAAGDGAGVSVQLVSISVDDVTLNLIEAIEQQLDAAARTNIVSPELQSAYGQLYSQIWVPLEPYLDGVDHVVICPDGQLSHVPWAGLRDPEGRFLVDRYTLSFTPDIVLFLSEQAFKPAETGKLIAIGNPNYRGHEKFVSFRTGKVTGLPRQWSTLPGADVELSRVCSLREEGETVRISEAEATESQLLDHVENARFLHVAAHGFYIDPNEVTAKATSPTAAAELVEFLEDRPLSASGIVLANPANEIEGSYDGFLTSSEVLNLDLRNLELVTLSSCYGANGRSWPLQGELGISRAFLLAGARSVLSNRLPVDDDATVALMEEFYAGVWNRGESKAEALRKAQRKMMNEYPPSKWATWTIQGDWR